MIDSWTTTRRLFPHAQICWGYIKAGKWGSSTNLTELESLARVFRQTGHYDEASTIYRMMVRGLGRHAPTPESDEFLADVLANLGLVYTHQRKGSGPEAFKLFQRVHQGLGDSSRPGDPQPAQVSLKLNMGRALTKLGDFSKAQELLEEMISVYTDWWGRRHPETMRAIDEMAWTLMESCADRQMREGDIDVVGAQRAGDLWSEALDFYRCTGGHAPDTVARIEANLSQLSTCTTTDASSYLTSVGSISRASQTDHRDLIVGSPRNTTEKDKL